MNSAAIYSRDAMVRFIFDKGAPEESAPADHFSFLISQQGPIPNDKGPQSVVIPRTVWGGAVQNRTKISVVVILVAIIAILVIMRQKKVGITKAMNVHDKVGQSVKTWANYPTFPSDDALLQVVWT